MDILDYAEAAGDRSVEVSRKAYDMLHERVYKTATALTAGAWAAGAVALGKIGEPGAAIQWVPLAVLALYWFGVTCFLILRGATSNPVSPGNGSGDLFTHYSQGLVAEAGEDNAAAMARSLRQTRTEELGLKQGRLEAYIRAHEKRSKTLDRTFRLIAASPLLPALSVAAVLLVRYFG